ncbi:conserved protein, unknown function [Hepatocystis sp. ex Piliocolobus tephrosceles]|nr:conserved protein, unknown function [Hepatocystis sp. ex Piliocolobus tephrosceles]
MSKTLFKDVSIVICDSFFSDDDSGEEKHKTQNESVIENENELLIHKDNKINNDDYTTQTWDTSVYETNNVEDANKKLKVAGDEKKERHNNVYSKEHTENYFNFENYLDSTNDESSDDNNNIYMNVNAHVSKEVGNKKVWHDSDDNSDNNSDDGDELNKLIKSDCKKKLKNSKNNKSANSDLSEEEENENEDENEMYISKKKKNDMDSNNIDISHNKNNNFNEYIENVKIKSYKPTKAGEDSYNMDTSDLYIFDNDKTNEYIYNNKRRNKSNEKNIYLKFNFLSTNIKNIKEKKILQVVTTPHNNLIYTLYKTKLYLMQCKDTKLNILKKITFNTPIKSAEEHNECPYIISYDNFIRTYNLEKGVVYKSRIHGIPNQCVPQKIKFYKQHNKEEYTKNTNSFMYSLSFTNSGKINIYDSRCTEVVKSFNMDNDYIGMDFHKNTNSLFSIDNKGYLYNWCLNTNKLKKKIIDNYTVFPTLLNVSNSYLVTCSFNGFLNLYDVNNLDMPIKSFKNLTHSITEAVFSPSNDHLLYLTPYCKNGVRLINLKKKYVYCNIPWFQSEISYNIHCANFFNSGNSMLTAARQNLFYVYNILPSEF